MLAAKMLCHMRSGTVPCDQDARWEVVFGGNMNVPVCDEHLEAYRRVAAEWGTTEKMERMIRPLSADPDATSTG